MKEFFSKLKNVYWVCFVFMLVGSAMFAFSYEATSLAWKWIFEENKLNQNA